MPDSLPADRPADPSADHPSNHPSNQWKIFDHLLDAVFIVDKEGRLHYMNESFRHLCDAPQRAIANHDEATKYIELPDECWAPLRTEKFTEGESAGYREVGFITKSGTMGRAQIFTDRVKVPEIHAGDLFYLILRDVTVEARLHAKYKVQIENNERLIRELQRSLNETAFLRRLATDLPIYADKTALLTTIANRMKQELSFRDANFFQVPTGDQEMEPVGVDKRMGSRLREAVRLLSPSIQSMGANEIVSSVVFKPFGLFWITFFRPRLEQPVVLVSTSRQGSEENDHRVLLETLSGQVSTLLDNHSLYFASISETTTGLFNQRFFDSRFGIECLRSAEKRTPLTLLLVETNELDAICAQHGASAVDSVLTALGQLVKRRLRTSDIAARIGENQLALLLPDTSPEDAANVADSLRKQAAGLSISAPGLDKQLNITLSVGMSGFRWMIDTQATVLKTAAEDLQKMKDTGRNQTSAA